MIDLQPYSSTFDDLEPGQTARVNHDDCSAGKDIRRRLYITRTMADSNLIIAYCHNCQDNGQWRTSKHTKYRGPKVSYNSGEMPMVSQIDSHICTKPEGMIEGNHLMDWPVEHRAWAFQNKLSLSWCINYGLAYDPTTDRVYLPRYDVVCRGNDEAVPRSRVRYTRGLLKGYQLRNVYKDRRTPKYLTVTADTDKGYTMIDSGATSRAVVVEDLVSGIHVAEAWSQGEKGRVDVFVNYGVKPNLEMLHHMMGNHDEILIWLDNDGYHVCNQAQAMGKTCLLLNSKANVVVEALFKDPKHYSSEVIREVVDRV